MNFTHPKGRGILCYHPVSFAATPPQRGMRLLRVIPRRPRRGAVVGCPNGAGW